MFDDPLPLASQSVDTTAGRLYGLCTIGYGGRSLAEVMAMLIAAEVPLLVDVRTTPWTRLPGFGKHELARALPSKGLRYTHVWDLGNVNWREGQEAAVILNDEGQGLETLTAFLRQSAVAIMCCERSYRRCHREYIAERMGKRVPGLVVRHL